MVFVHGLSMNSTASSSTPYVNLKAKLVPSYPISLAIHHPALGDQRLTTLMDVMLALLFEDKEKVIAGFRVFLCIKKSQIQAQVHA